MCHLLLARANKLPAASFGDLPDVFVPDFSPPLVLPTRWESGRWSVFFGCKREGSLTISWVDQFSKVILQHHITRAAVA